MFPNWLQDWHIKDGDQTRLKWSFIRSHVSKLSQETYSSYAHQEKSKHILYK